MEYISVIILNKAFEERGLLANVTFVLGLSAGRELPSSTFGSIVTDGDGRIHQALTNIGHHVRKAGGSKLASLRNELADMPDVQVIDYTEDAAPADYDEYSRTLSKHKSEEIVYRAIHVYGPSAKIIPLTKNLSRA